MIDLEIESGDLTGVLYFDAGQAGLSGFTVRRARGGGAPTDFNSPTIAEINGMLGVYSLLVDEDTDISAANVATQTMVVQIQAAGMAPVTKNVLIRNRAIAELNVNVTQVNGVTVQGNGQTGDLWRPA